MATLIKTPSDLDNIRNDLSGTYELANDIDMSSWGNFKPLSNLDSRFTGVLDGKGHKIKNLTISETSQYTGLFGIDNDSIIKNIGLENASVSSDNSHVGALIGRLYGTIKNCYSTGAVYGADNTGGLIGSSYGGAVEDSYSTCTVIGSSTIGGFIGDSGASYSNPITRRCYSTGDVEGNSRVGGFTGRYDTYTPDSVVKYCYYNSDNYPSDPVASGISSAKMKSQLTYTNWDFTNVWGIDGEYPYLKVFGEPVAETAAKVETITVTAHLNSIGSLLSNSKKSTQHSITFMSPLHAQNKRSVATKRDVKSYTSPINTDVTQAHSSVRTSSENVTSYISPIASSVTKQSKSVQQLLSYVSPIQTSLDLLIPTDNSIVNAYLSIVSNPSDMSAWQNKSNISYIENPSNMEVI